MTAAVLLSDLLPRPARQHARHFGLLIDYLLASSCSQGQPAVHAYQGVGQQLLQGMASYRQYMWLVVFRPAVAARDSNTLHMPEL